MIKTPKKQLYSFYSYFISSRKYPPIKIVLNTIVLVFFYITLPIYLISKTGVTIKILFIFYLFFILAAYYLINKFFKNKSYILLETQQLSEKINTKTDQIDKENKILTALDFKIKRYNSLKNIIQDINITFDLLSISEKLVDVAFSQIAHGRGICLLYLVDAPNQKLNLCIAKKENPNLVIKAKEGDIFDKWVLRRTSALFIEDIKKDFRFDIEKIDLEHRRHISSLISSPLVSDERIFGILRLDNPDAQYFSLDDSRFLNTISDLGAVALENFELFKATQELAITDDLTSLYRKGFFLERLKEEFKRSLHQKKELALLMVDIDHFKDYNDKFGHTAGDIVLKGISDAMVNFFKEDNAILCRFGGEEFCVLLPDIKKKNAFLLAEQFRKIIQNKTIILRRQKTNITVSIGLASYPEDATSEEELLSKSDLVMYQAKEEGRNRICST